MAAIDFTDIKSCMGANDEVLYSSSTNITTALWDTSGFISMGTRPNGDSTPSNWNPTDTTLKNSVFWDGLFPWISIYSGMAHTATNVRVEISKFECFVYSNIQKAWVDLTTNDTKLPASELNMNFIMLSTSGTADKRVESNGNISYKLDSTRRPIKAFLAPKSIYGADVGGVIITCRAKLILDDPFGFDDIAAGNAHLLLSVGTDFRPSVTTDEAAFTPEKSPPAFASKFTLISGVEKTFYAVPLNPPGIPDTGSVWYAAGNRAHIDSLWFQRNHPKTFFDRDDIFDDAELAAPLKTSLIPLRASGTPTFTRATVATVFTDEGKLTTIPSGIARFSGARFVQNRFSRSESFELSGWTKTNLDTITSGHADHLGGTKARFVQVTANSPNTLNTTGAGAIDNISGDEVCFSIHVKAGNWNQFVLQIQTPSKNVHQYFNLSTGTLGTSTTSGGATKVQALIEDVGSGWYRVQLTAKFAQGDGVVTCALRVVMADGAISYTGVAGANYYLAFAQAEKVERRTSKTASEYISSGEAVAPFHGAGADSCKWFDTHHDGLEIPEDDLLGYEYCSTDRTNLALWNRDLTNVVWVKTNITPTLDQTGIDGIANQASRLVATAANGTVFQTLSVEGFRSSSAYVKRLTGTGRIDFTRNGGGTWTDITTLINSDGYTKISIEADNVLNPVIGFRIGTSGNSIAVDFIQDENGSDATNPIYTTSTSASRNADILTLPNTNINDTEGTILAKVTKRDWNNSGAAVISSKIALYPEATISRSTTATVFTDEGKLVTIPANVARFPGARFVRNIFSKSESFEGLGWTKTNLTDPSIGHADHLGGTKARFIEVIANSANLISTTSAGAIDNISGDEVCFSIYIKAGNWNQFVLQMQTSGKVLQQYFNLSTGTLGTSSATNGVVNIQSMIEDAGSGWYRVQATAKFAQGDGTVTCMIRVVMTDGTIGYSAVAGANYYLAFAQAEKVERRTLKTASEYISSGEAVAPFHGAGADSCKWSDTHHDGTPIDSNDLLGLQYNTSNKTNLALWNRDLTNAVWVKTNITPTLDQTGIDGIANQASRLVATAANGTVFQIIATSGSRSSSAYVKRLTGTGRIDFTRNGGGTWTDITTLINSDGYTRVTITDSTGVNPSVGFRIVVDADAIAVDFIQDENGSDATNPIYTTTTSSRRVSDIFTYPYTNFSNWTKSSGAVIGSPIAGLFSSGSVNGALGRDGQNTCNPIDKNYIGKGEVIPSLAIRSGHFWAAYAGTGGGSTGTNPGAWTSIRSEIANNPGLLGVQLRWCWADLENDVGGTYDFSSIQARLDELAALPGKVGLLCMMFEHKGDIPAYLKTAFYDFGQYEYTGGQSGNVVNSHNLCYWNVNVQERLRLLAIELGKFLNDKPNFENFTTQESANATPVPGTGPGYSYQGFVDGLVKFASRLKENMPNKVVRISLNFSGQTLGTAYPTAAGAKLSFSFPNTLDNHPGLEKHQRLPGSYTYARTYKDSNGVMPEVQRPDYYYTNLTWNMNRDDGYKVKIIDGVETLIPPSGGYRPTIRQLRDFLMSNFNVKQIFWSRASYINTVTGNNYVNEVLDFINLPENQVDGWGLSTETPTIYQQGAPDPTGSINMALSWLGDKMHLNVEGSPCGLDSNYAGTFNLSNLGIGVDGTGFVKDVYVWKSIISDDEKRQVTSKKGVALFSRNK